MIEELKKKLKGNEIITSFKYLTEGHCDLFGNKNMIHILQVNTNQSYIITLKDSSLDGLSKQLAKVLKDFEAFSKFKKNSSRMKFLEVDLSILEQNIKNIKVVLCLYEKIDKTLVPNIKRVLEIYQEEYDLKSKEYQVLKKEEKNFKKLQKYLTCTS